MEHEEKVMAHENKSFFVSKKDKLIMTSFRLYQSQTEKLAEIAEEETLECGDITTVSALIRLAVDDLIDKYNELKKNNNKVDWSSNTWYTS